MRPITKSQKTIIHTLKSKLGMPDESYRAMLTGYRTSRGMPVTSSKDLSYRDAEELIKALEKDAVKISDWDPRKRHHDRPETIRSGMMASQEQVRMIEGMWAEYSSIRDDKKRSAALDLWIFRHWNRGGLMMVERDLVGAIIHALEAMIDQAQRTPAKKANRGRSAVR